MLKLLWFIQTAPLAAFAAIALGGRALRRPAPWIALAASGAVLAAVLVLFARAAASGAAFEWSRPWLGTASLGTLPLFGLQPARLSDVSVGFLLDPLNLLMLTVVAAVSFAVQAFSVYYMSEEGDKPRYFAFLSFFSFAMTGLVLSANLLQTFVFWELVGLASYLLIGFWFEKPSASDAARKAFVLNRLADLGFLAAVALLFLTAGNLDLRTLSDPALHAALGPAFLGPVTFLVFLGVAGKSAQFPFHVWLPDAMEGPTPVSALIHSATMVAAGVFLLARLFPFFSAAPATLEAILAVGALTALLAATMAAVQRDVKRVLAYSTISQLGLMVMGIASGAWVAGVFHLTTHAFFKSLLFLTAGAFIHRFGTNDLFEMGRGGAGSKRFLVGALALGLLSLAGIPPFGGFFSKDAILHHLKETHLPYYLAGLGVTCLTAFYSLRAFLILTRTPAARGGHEHAPAGGLGPFEQAPLAALAAASVAAGLLGTPLGGEALVRFLDPYGHAAPFDAGLLAAVGGVIAAGAAAAWRLYRSPDPSREEAADRNPARAVIARKYFLDDAYRFLVKTVGLRIAHFFHRFDVRVVNGFFVNGTAANLGRLGRLFSRMQSGVFPDYAFVAVLTGVAVLAYLAAGGR
jgi:NADH-quinone oxidoreductase subunit L